MLPPHDASNGAGVSWTGSVGAMGIRVGIDTGGTFTDLVAVDDASGRWYVAKVPSNPGNPVAAISAALGTAGFDPADVTFVVVGTTIGINAVLTRKGARVLYLTTRGFEDVPYIQRINRKHHYDFHWRKPEPLMHRPDCLPVAERVDEEGGVLEPIDLDGLGDRVAERLAANGGGPVAVAVCLLFSYLNPDHERATRELLRERFPDLPVSLSHEIAPIWREYERGTTTAVDAYTKPLFERYVDGVSTALDEQGVAGRWALLKSNGGHALAHEARERPAHLLLSGIAGGAIGGAHMARAADGAQAVALDMGGTSCDVCLIVDGEPLYSSDFEIEFGLPVSVQSVSTRTIGAGGGSIGWVDPGGFLQVGPQSAGADPGPARVRPRWHGGDHHRRQHRARPARSRVLPRRPDAARAGARAHGHRAPRRAPRVRRDRGRLRRHPHRQREHGERDPHRHGRGGHRSARVRADRVRRCRSDARLRDRRRDRHVARRRPAAPGAVLGVRRARGERPRGCGAQRLPDRSPHLGCRPRRPLPRARGRGARGRRRAGRQRARRAPGRSRCAIRARTTSRR